jgi:hypothetical protein
MSEQLPLLPALKATDWVGCSHALCRPLAPELDTPYMPWVAFGYDHPHTFEFVTSESMPGGSDPDQLQLLEYAAVRNLRDREAVWQSQKVTAAGRKLSLLVCCDDFLAAERVLDQEFMAEAQSRLKTKLLAVAVPQRGLLLAFDSHQSREKVGLFATIAAAQFFQTGNAPISPVTFLMNNGKIVGIIKGPEEHGQAVADTSQQDEPEIYKQVIVVSNRETESESLHILIGGADPAYLARTLARVFTQGLQEMQQHEQFDGEVLVVVVPYLTPYCSELEKLLPEVEAHLQGVATELHERGMFTTPVNVTIRYGMPGDNPPPEPPPEPSSSPELPSESSPEPPASPSPASSGIRRIKPSAQPVDPPVAVRTFDMTGLMNALSSEHTDTREAAIARLVEQGRQDQQVVRRLIALLGNSNSYVSLGAVQTLALIGESVVPFLRLAVAKGDERMREFAIVALGNIAPRPLLPDLIEWMRDPVEGVRHRATDVVAQLKEPAASDALLQALHDSNPDIRVLAMAGLGELGDHRAVAPLMEFVQDPSDKVRAGAVAALNTLHDEQALPALVTAACDSEEQVMHIAITSVKSFGSQAVPYITAARDQVDKQVDPRVYQLLSELLADCRAKRGRDFLDKAGAFWWRK